MSRLLRAGAVPLLWIVMTSGGATAVETVKGAPPERRETTFTIAFDGLMVHIGDESDSARLHKQLLAVVDAPGHEAVLTADAADRFRGEGDLRMPLRKGDVVTFNLPAGTVDTDESFRARVPALRPLLEAGSLRDTVKRGLPDDGVVAYVKYPAGRLSAPETFAHPAEYRFGNGRFVDKRCVARTVLFQSTTFARSLTLTVTNTDGAIRTATLRAGATLRVTNLSASSSDHFHMYRELTSATDMASMHEDRATYCGSGEGLMATGVRSESVGPGCSNSDFP